MNAVEIGAEIFSQHAKLRALIEKTRSATARIPRHQAGADPGLVACVGRLASDLRDHNLCEEQLLRVLPVTADCWGRAGAESVHERHMAEHRELEAALVAAPFNPKRLGYFLDRLLAHMVWEEQSFLGEDALRDHTIIIATSCG
jgi:hypothetical protein